MWKRILAIFMFLGGMGFGALTASLMWDQDLAIRTFVQAPGQGLDSQVHVSHSSRGTSYSVSVRYEYTWKGEEQEGTNVEWIGGGGGSASWCNWVADNYGAGKHFVVYVDPDKPDQSMLFKDYSTVPYWGTLALGWLGWWGLMIALGATGPGPEEMRVVSLGEEGWHLVLPRKSLRRRLGEAMGWLAGMGIICGVVAGHYALRVDRVSIAGWALLLACAVLVGHRVWRAGQRWLVLREMSDVRVQVNPAPLKRGEAVSVVAEADVYRPMNVLGVEGRLVCIEHYKERSGNKTRLGTREAWSGVMALAGASDVRGGEMVQGSGAVTPPAEKPPTTVDRVGYPYFTWELRVKVVVKEGADYEEVFAVEVG